MIDMRIVDFGFADAETEFNHKPEMFDKVFIDPKDYLSELLFGLKCMVIGRKGSGKTAYSAKIRRMAMDKTNKFVAHNCLLSSMEYSVFDEYNNAQFRGGRKYQTTWEFLLLIELLKLINESFPENENEEFYNLIEKLEKADILSSEDIMYTINSMQNQEFVAKFTFLEGKAGRQQESKNRTLSSVCAYIRNVLKQTSFAGYRIYLLLDGLDDALRGERFSSEILAGLNRAIIGLNQFFSKLDYLCVKIILFVRTDIFDMCCDPDMTKQRLDYAVTLAWSKEELEEIVMQRVQQQYPEQESFQLFWREHFPLKQNNKSTLGLFFDYTLLRPRDVLQFFRNSKDLFLLKHQAERFTHSEFKEIVARYSEDYFIAEMKDELTGFFPDACITVLPQILSIMERSKFTVKHFTETMSEFRELEYVNADALLKHLFSCGYIGQVKYGGLHDQSMVCFKHINPRMSFDARYDCLIHRGLRKALNLY